MLNSFLTYFGGTYYIYYFSEVMLLIIGESNEYEAWWNDND